MINVDKEFGIAIQAIGGERLDARPKGTFPGKNADFYFPAEGVVAELKSLDKDVIHDPASVEKASAIYESELKKGNAKKIAFGTVQISADDVSPEAAERLIQIYRVPLRRVIRDADEQLGASKRDLGLDPGVGILLLENSNNTALHPSNLVQLISEIFAGEADFPHIDHVIFFTVNMVSEIDGQAVHIWKSSGRKSRPQPSKEFLKQLPKAWYSHQSRLIGEPIREIEGSIGLLNSMKNQPKKM